jgi:DNA-binding PadR family transcriptional regulator
VPESTTLTPLSHAVLLSLADEERHGYGIIKTVERQSDGALRPGTGTLYTALQRLLDEGLIEESDREPGPEEDRRRRYYRLTAAGLGAARTETLRLARLVALARDKAVVANSELARALGIR